MTKQLPKFDSPPVVETVLSAQFNRLQGYTNAHAGWFWKNYLDSSWVKISQVMRLDDQFERFGEERKWAPRTRGFQFAPAESSERTHIQSEDGERMIQIQDSRFIYNWRKRSKDYPSFEKNLPDFNDNFGKYSKFARDAGLGDIELNQWEVTYVNHIPKGELWQEPNDWSNLFPGFFVPASSLPNIDFDNFRGNWQSIISDEYGRLYIDFSRGKILTEDGPEIIVIEITARGPISKEKGISLEQGFKIGHECIVTAFTEMTSESAHLHWKRTQ